MSNAATVLPPLHEFARLTQSQIEPPVMTLVAGSAEGSGTQILGQHPRVVSETIEIKRGFSDGYWLAGGAVVEPLRAHIEVDAVEIVASEPTTGIFGVGDDLAAAIADLREALVEHLVVLEGDEPLSEQLSKHRDWLRRHVRLDA